MSSLTVYHENQPEQPLKLLTHAEDIASTLAEVGVRFERWEAAAPIAAGARRSSNSSQEASAVTGGTR